MALAAKACRRGDLDERRVRPRKLPAGEFNSQLANVLTNRATVVLTKRTSQVNRMHTYERSN